MSAKFVSKNSNLMVVLSPGIPGSPITGQQPKSGIYVRFQSGVVEVKDDHLAEMLRKHQDFNIDFLEIKPEELDPYAYNRDEIEPAHVIAEIKYGHSEKLIGSKKKVKLSPEVQKLLETEAVRMLPGLLKANPQILGDILKELASAAAKKEDKAEVKRGPGRPKAEQKEEGVSDEVEEVKKGE